MSISIEPGSFHPPARVTAWQCLLFACAVRRRRFPVGESPTRRALQPEATGAVMEALSRRVGLAVILVTR
jgi:hypothetical protein